MSPSLCFLQLTLISNNPGLWRLEFKKQWRVASDEWLADEAKSRAETLGATVAPGKREQLRLEARKHGVRKWGWVLKKSRNSAIRNESGRLFSVVCIEF